MAKKKAVKPQVEDDEDINEFVEDLLENEKFESVYPKVEEKSKREAIPSSIDESVEEEEEEFEFEEEPRFPDYKYLNLKVNKGQSENDYELIVEGQSHGFCNIFVKHLLKIEGVNIAAYKSTGISPSQIFIRLENSKNYKIKDILHKGIESLREEVLEVQKLFKKLT
ncbi:MAG: RpoL/Rpb11 RNA polymerase subunit family protein [Candidatus Odinarchaeota archaeon]